MNRVYHIEIATKRTANCFNWLNLLNCSIIRFDFRSGTIRAHSGNSFAARAKIISPSDALSGHLTGIEVQLVLDNLPNLRVAIFESLIGVMRRNAIEIILHICPFCGAVFGSMGLFFLD